MKLSPASGTLLLLALAISLTASLPGQSQSPARSTRNSAEGATQSANAGTGKRKIPCKTPGNALLCYWIYGRLGVYNGNPSERIWKIGTRRILGVFNGPLHFPPRENDGFENPELPTNLETAYDAAYRRWKQSKEDVPYDFPLIFGDFEVCPLEPEKKGEMQAVCIESAKNILAQK